MNQVDAALPNDCLRSTLAALICCLVLGGCDRTAPAPAPPGSSTPAERDSSAPAAQRPPILLPPRPVRPSASAAPFEAEAWLRDHGVDLDGLFGQLDRTERDRILQQHYGRCRPLSLQSMDVLLCPEHHPTPGDPLIYRVDVTAVWQVANTKLRIANKLLSRAVPRLAQPVRAGVFVVIRGDGDDLVVADPLGACDEVLAGLQAKQAKRGDLASSLATVRRICDQRGRYRYDGTKFVKR